MCIHIYTSICTYTYTCVCVCVSSRQCNRVLYQKPLSLHLLWNDLGLSHCEFPIHHPDYKLLLCMTHGSKPVTHSHLLTMNKPVSRVTVMWRDRERSPLVTGRYCFLSQRAAVEDDSRFTFLHLPCALKEPHGTFSTLLWCLSSKPKILRGKLPSLLWWWSYGEENLPDTFLTFVCSSDIDILGGSWQSSLVSPFLMCQVVWIF